MEPKLERSLSLGGSVGLIVGLVIGASIFVLIPQLAGMTGPSLYLAYGVSVIPTIFTSLYLVQLAGALPVTGANYVAITRLISPMAGFVSSVAAVVGMIATNCLVAWGFAEYVGKILPGLPVTSVAVGIVLFFGLINWIGVKIFEWAQVFMVILLLAAMLIFGIAGLFHVSPENTTPLFPNGIGQFILVVAIATFSWGGFIAIVEVAGEVKNPRRTIPRAIVISLFIVLLLYVLQTFVFTGVLNWQEAGRMGPTAFIVASSLFLPPAMVHFIVVAALLAMATSINSIMLMAAREAFAWSRDHVIPVAFNRIHPRFKTPERTILVTTVFSVAGVLFAADLEKYALMVVYALMVAQGLGAAAVWRMPKLMPEIYGKSLFKFPPLWRNFIFIGCLTVFGLIFTFGWVADYKTGLIFFAIMGLSLLYWYGRVNVLAGRGIHLGATLSKLSHETIEELEQ